MALIHMRRVTLALIEEGLVPMNCLHAELVMEPETVLKLRYTVAVSEQDLPKLARVLARVAEEQP